MSANNNISLIFLIALLNINMFYSAVLTKTKFSIKNVIVEIKSEEGFFEEVVNGMQSIDRGEFIHYDYSQSEEEEEEENYEGENEENEGNSPYEESEESNCDENEDLSDEENEETLLDQSSFEESELEELENIKTRLLEMTENGYSYDSEELKSQLSKLEKIMKKYNTENALNSNENKGEIDFEGQGSFGYYSDEEENYFDEDNQNSVMKFYVEEKLLENQLDENSFNEEIIGTVKKLNLLKLLTMETKAKVEVAAIF